MFITWYDKVVSRLPLFVEQNINAEGTFEVQEKTRGKNIERFKCHSYTTINLIPGQAYYTKNDSYAFEEVLKERMVTQH